MIILAGYFIVKLTGKQEKEGISGEQEEKHMMETVSSLKRGSFFIQLLCVGQGN